MTTAPNRFRWFDSSPEVVRLTWEYRGQKRGQSQVRIALAPRPRQESHSGDRGVRIETNQQVDIAPEPG